MIGVPEVSHAVILAAGTGTRMRPWTDHMPKAMLPLGRRPIIEFVADELRFNLVRTATLVTSPASDLGSAVLRRTMEDAWTSDQGSVDGLTFASQFRSHPGTAEAILSAFHPKCEIDPPSPFIVMLADDVIEVWPEGTPSVLISRMATAYVRHPEPVDAVLAVRKVPRSIAHRYGIVTVDESSVVTSIVEKPEDPQGELAIIGRYVLGPGFRQRVLEAREEHDPIPETGTELTWALARMVEHGGRVIAVQVESQEMWHDTGNIEGYLLAFRRMAEREILEGSGG